MSTWDSGHPRLRLLMSVIFVMFGFGIFFMVCGVIMITAGLPWPLAVIYFVFAVVFIAAGVWNMIPETFTADENGVGHRKWFLDKKASWAEVTSIENANGIGWLSPAPRMRPLVIVRTNDWTVKMRNWKYDTDYIKFAFTQLAMMSKANTKITLVDELFWLPRGVFGPGVVLGNIRQFVLLMKVGAMMMVLSAIAMLLWFVHLFLLFAGCAFIFIGLMCLVAGVIGYFDEKKKIADRV